MTRIAVLLGLAVLSGTALNAGAYTYTYTGEDFTLYQGTYSPGIQTNISASITLASPIGDDFNGSVTPLSFEITDGFLTLTYLSDIYSPLIPAPTFEFQTNSADQIVSWDVGVYAVNGETEMFMQTFKDVDYPESVYGVDGSGYCSPAPACFDNALGYANNQYYSSIPAWYGPGQTPEPSTSSLILLGGGLLGTLPAFRRLRRRPLPASARAPLHS